MASDMTPFGTDSEEGGGGTFGELGKEIKNQISHRKKAMQGLSNHLEIPVKVNRG